MADNPEAKWVREFKELGASRVRDGVVVGGWERDKQQAARRWLERQDVKAWQAKQANVPADRKSVRDRLRGSKWWIYAVAAIFVLVSAGRILRRW